jgi:hypothetical protein
MARPSARAFALAALALWLSGVGVVVPASARQMDPKQVAGIPLPVADVPAGTVVVRVIRGSLTNNLANHPVELIVAGRPRSATTDATGRAQFSGLEPGTEVTAAATVGTERLQSQTFRVPSSGGIRLLLVATDPNAAAPAAGDPVGATPPGPMAAAQPGTIALGDQSRLVFEFGDGSISVFNLMQVVNGTQAPVQPAQPLVFELPAGATGATVLEDSTEQAKADARRVIVTGPFAPGATLVQFAYSMPYSGADLTIEQKMPSALARVIVLAQKGGEMRLSSPQMTEQREMTADGNVYIVGQGPGVAAGTALSFHFSNLPHAPTWPRNVALGLAVAILLAGAWASRRTVIAPAADRARDKLESRREKLFAELAALEQQHRDGRIEAARYAERRADLVAALERVYAEIDRRAA